MESQGKQRKGTSSEFLMDHRAALGEEQESTVGEAPKQLEALASANKETLLEHLGAPTVK